MELILQILEVIQTGGIVGTLIIVVRVLYKMREESERREQAITDDYIEYLKLKANGEVADHE